MRTYLSESDAKEWAAAAAAGGALADGGDDSGSDEAHRCGVFVVLFSDGDISSVDAALGALGGRRIRLPQGKTAQFFLGASAA